METRTVGYLIERQPQQTPTKYLGVNAGSSDSPELCTGYFTWIDNPHDALRFARKLDAVVFIGALRSLSAQLPHGSTLAGLRNGDPAPIVAEHLWIDAETEVKCPVCGYHKVDSEGWCLQPETADSGVPATSAPLDAQLIRDLATLPLDALADENAPPSARMNLFSVLRHMQERAQEAVATPPSPPVPEPRRSHKSPACIGGDCEQCTIGRDGGCWCTCHLLAQPEAEGNVTQRVIDETCA